MTGEHRIVVLGAGCAGLSAAKQAARVPGARVTVIEARAHLVERVRLHQALAGQRIPRWDLRELLERKGIEFVQARAVRIDTMQRSIELEGNWSVSYDSLIYALGSIGQADGVPGAAEFARAVATPEDVRQLPALSGRVAVVGGGATGIETATELAEARPDLTVLLLSAEEPGAWLSDKARGHIRAVLDRLGVPVYSGAKVVEVHPDGVELAGGDRIQADTVLWTTGFAVPAVAADSGLAVNAQGRVLVDDELRSRSHPEIYAVGDAAIVAGPGARELRMACATALPAGKYAATALAARLRGKEPAPRRFRYYFQCISLGRADGVI
ncbi:NAD(P)/FAD-dependent oxidoreductase [Nocardia crassostreae]|uniref:NAD(P)/FAD-dependent oxidoreductase n=1 Tax=Nocardia crassostreae TaxID=53428 RepID=UPI000A53973A|nr:FAD-dependent oxidoreductase [Nocardia crassostreae]